MKRQTLQFYSFESLAAFSRLLSYGYLMNTNRLTLTSTFIPEHLKLALNEFDAALVDTTEKTFTY